MYPTIRATASIGCCRAFWILTVALLLLAPVASAGDLEEIQGAGARSVVAETRGLVLVEQS